MSREFNGPSSYLDFPTGDRMALMARANKDLENEQLDYDSLLDGNPNPSLRDQEYLQHRLALLSGVKQLKVIQEHNVILD